MGRLSAETGHDVAAQCEYKWGSCVAEINNQLHVRATDEEADFDCANIRAFVDAILEDVEPTPSTINDALEAGVFALASAGGYNQPGKAWLAHPDNQDRLQPLRSGVEGIRFALSKCAGITV